MSAEVEVAKGVHPKRMRHTNRSRPTTAIKLLAQDTTKRVLSQKATDMLEDIMNYSCKEVMDAAASLCSGSKKTVTKNVAMSAFALVFRHSAIQKKSHEVGETAFSNYKAAESAHPKVKGAKRAAVKLSGEHSVIKHILSANRVGTMMRRYMAHPCERISEGSIIYATGFLENFIACIIKSANVFIKGSKDRMKAKDISSALSNDLELRGIIPDELVVKFHGQHSGVKRKRPASSSEKKPAQKRSRKH